MTERNWAGNLTYRARAIHRPETLDELRAVVAGAPRIRALGTRHSFSAIADSGELVSLAAMPPGVAIDRDADTVSLGAATTYGALAPLLGAAGLALANMASLPHISVAGAIATATHGSGDRNGNLATAVEALELVTSSGDVVRLARGDAGFDGAVVGLGALGVVTRVTLAVEPAYELRQRVFEGLPWDALHDHFDAITGAGHSVSVFTRWHDDAADQVWVKSRAAGPEEPRAELFGARAATVDRHPILGLDPVNCTPQLGRAGAWSDRLSHFRMGFTPSSGDELQSEYIVDRAHAAAAIDAVRGLAGVLRPVVQVSEIRTIAADALWMSPQHRADSVAIHFTWAPDRVAVDAAIAQLERALEPFGARPHWGKLFALDAGRIAALYDRLPEFAALARRLDPRGAFRNDWLAEHVG